MYFLLIFNVGGTDVVGYSVSLFLNLKLLSLLGEQIPRKVHRRTLGSHFQTLHGFGWPAEWLTCFRHHSSWDSSNSHFNSTEHTFCPQYPIEIVLAMISSDLLILFGPSHWSPPWNIALIWLLSSSALFLAILLLLSPNCWCTLGFHSPCPFHSINHLSHSSGQKSLSLPSSEREEEPDSESNWQTQWYSKYHKKE